MKNGSRVAVTGATGFVGWHVSTLLRARGVHTRAIVRPGSTKALPTGVEAVEAALVDPDALARGLEGCDAVVHAAGVIRAADASGFDSVNVAGTRAIVDAANATGTKLVLVSSLAAIGAGTAAHPAREDDAPRPLNAYGRSKLAGEMVVRSHARIPWAIIRPPAVYGPRDRGFLPLFRLASRGVFLHAVRATMPFTFVYVDDLARGIAAAALSDRADGQALFIAHPQIFTADDLMRQLAAVFGRRYRVWRVPHAVLAAAARVGDLSWQIGVKPALDSSRLQEFNADGFVCAVDRARETLGFDAEVPLADGLQRTARWYREHGWL